MMQDSFSNRQNSRYLFVKELTTRRIWKLGSPNTQVCRIFLSVVTDNGKRGNLFNTLRRNSTYFHTYDNDLLRRKNTHARIPTEDKVAASGWIFCRVLARRRTHTNTPKQNLSIDLHQRKHLSPNSHHDYPNNCLLDAASLGNEHCRNFCGRVFWSIRRNWFLFSRYWSMW